MNNHDLGTSAGEFWDTVREQVRRGQCNFKGHRFPEDPTLKCFKEMVFTGETDFEGAVFEGGVDFNQATFEKAAVFNWRNI